MVKEYTERVRIPAQAREALNAISAMHSILRVYENQFRKLFGRVEMEERYNNMVNLIEEVTDKILDTIPIEQLKTIKHSMEISTIHVGVRPAGQRPDDQWVISYQDLADLAEYATKMNCLACDNTNKPCRLRDILKDLPIQGVERVVVGCWDE